MRGTDSVTVRVPGSTSNCGSGFDTLGLALALVERADPLGGEIEGLARVAKRGAVREARKATEEGTSPVILIGVSGSGQLDLPAYQEFLAGRMADS